MAKLADMGLAKYFTIERRTSTSHGPRGTLSYMDPQYIDTHSYTPASDVYSFGMVLLQILTSERLPGRSKGAARKAVKHENFDTIVDSRMPG